MSTQSIPRRPVDIGQSVPQRYQHLSSSTPPSQEAPHFPHLTHFATVPEARNHLEQHEEVIVEEDEETETSSEPKTPIGDSHPHPLTLVHNGSGDNHTNAAYHSALSSATLPSAGATIKPLISNTPATPPPSNVRETPTLNTAPSKVATPTDFSARPPTRRTTSNSFRSLFRRSSSHTQEQLAPMTPLAMTALPSNTALYGAPLIPLRQSSISRSANVSPAASQPITPPSPASPTSTVTSNADARWDEPELFKAGNRASTGFSLRDRSKIKFSASTKAPPYDRKRSTSFNNLAFANGGKPGHPNHTPEPFEGAPNKLQGDFFTRPAETGAGLKARRMSINLPDDFIVDTVELDKEFTSASHFPGKKTKIGKGATATVKLMTRKGHGHGDEVFAVKEFRKRSSNESAEEYDKKVKSEYTIAKSLHHPNIVESIRLCSHNSRWNVVMEYCAHGELFTLVQKGYLTLEDRWCLFKQLLKGVDYLHAHGIAHRDIKLENLLMTDKGYLKITDFGVSEVFCGEHPGIRNAGGECGKNMKEKRKCAPGICGSKPYIAPEVLAKNGEYDPRPLDVWSCAIVYISMHFGGQAWNEATTADLNYAKYAAAYMKFLSTPEKPNPATFSPLTPSTTLSSLAPLTPITTTASSKPGTPTGELNIYKPITDTSYPVGVGKVFTKLEKPALKLLLLRMLHPIPEARLSIQDALNDKWLKGIECCVDYEEDLIAAKGKMGFDASKSCSKKKADMMSKKKMHHHCPVKESRAGKMAGVLQHRFDMGDGY